MGREVVTYKGKGYINAEMVLEFLHVIFAVSKEKGKYIRWDIEHLPGYSILSSRAKRIGLVTVHGNGTGRGVNNHCHWADMSVEPTLEDAERLFDAYRGNLSGRVIEKRDHRQAIVRDSDEEITLPAAEQARIANLIAQAATPVAQAPSPIPNNVLDLLLVIETKLDRILNQWEGK